MGCICKRHWNCHILSILAQVLCRSKSADAMEMCSLREAGVRGRCTCGERVTAYNKG